MKRLIALILGTLLLVFTFSACSPKNPEGVASFTLKDSSLEERGTEVPFPLNGVIGVPEGTNAPVVFILHGTHEVNDPKKDDYYAGFSYLAESLSKQGFFVVSLNINTIFWSKPIEGDPFFRAERIFDEYYSALEKANSGDKLFGINLEGKMDLSKINFIGHSRGGYFSLYLSKYLKSSGRDVTSALLVAPSVFSTLEGCYTDVPTGIIVPQYDGDVNMLDGYNIFNQAVLDKSRESDISAAFLFGGNHGWFNSKLGEDRLFTYENASYITPEKEREFLSDYAVDFLSLYNFGKGDLVSTLGSGFSERHGHGFSPSLYSPSHDELIGSQSSYLASSGLSVDRVIESVIPEKDTAGAFLYPVDYEQEIPLYSIAWEKAGESLSFDVSSGNAKTLLFTMALDSSKSKGAEFEIVITDSAGNKTSKTISSDNTEALKYYDGHLLDTQNPIWSTYTPLSSFSLDVSEIGEIKSIEINTVSDSGSLMLWSVRSSAN